MRTIPKHISNLLFEYDCVIVPGLGGFITNYKPAVINHTHHTFYPPSKQVSFNAGLDGNDGLLAHSVATELKVEYAEAVKIIEQEVHAIKISLLKGQKVELVKIGTLVSNSEDSIQFVPSNEVNYLGEAYGLTKFTSNAINRSSQDSIESLNTPAIRKTLKWAAVLVPFATIALWGALNTGTLNNLYNNYASVIPTTSKAVTYTKPAPVYVKPVVGKPVATAGAAPVETVKQEVAQKADCYFIIAGAFSVADNARKYVDQLKSEGYKASLAGQNSRNLHLVSIQSFSDEQSAAESMEHFHQNGFPSVWLLSKVE